MRISLSSPVRKSAFLGGCIATGVFAWVLCCQALAEYWMTRSGTVQGIERAARIQPLNALYPQELGTDFILSNPTQAASFLDESVRINPHAAATWLSLSRTYGVLGDYARQQHAISQALAVDPKNVDVEWEGSIFLFQSGDLPGGLRLIKEVITNDPAKAVSAIQAAYRATGGSVDQTLQAIPSTASARLQFLHWLVEHNQPEAADRVWPTVIAAHGKLESDQLFFYLDSLIDRQQVAHAQSLWKWIIQNDPSLRAGMEPGNLLVNGDFEDNLLNHGFGWRYSQMPGVNATIDTSVLHQGTRSLALEFDADKIADAGIYQLVPVDPGASYSLRAFARSEELESANGVRLQVSDDYSKAVLATTDEVLGSSPWSEMSATFVASPATKLLRIAVVRSPSYGRIRGKVWLDDFHLEKRP